MFGIHSHARTAVLEIGKVRPTMAGAINRFARTIRRADARQQAQLRRERLALRRRFASVRRTRIGAARLDAVRARLPLLGTRHPVPHRLRLPRRLSRRMPPTVLGRQRHLTGRGGRSPFAESVERRAEAVANAIRARLLALRRGLLTLQQRLASITRSRRRAGGY